MAQTVPYHFHTFALVRALTKAVDMGHTWSKYGNGMGQPMTDVWVLYGFYTVSYTHLTLPTKLEV